ncbi:MAG: cytochrome c3 family protein [Desulfovibrionaceae bacterium]
MKKLLLVSLMVAALFAAYTVAALAADAPAKPVEIKFLGDGAKYAPVMFDHSKHAALKCEDCHHKMAESKDMKCTTCHKDVTKENKKKPESFDSAFHAKSTHSCVGCHKEMKKGPTKCNECHSKK